MKHKKLILIFLVFVALAIVIGCVHFFNKKSRIIFCYDFNRVTIETDDVYVTEEEIDTYISKIKNNYAVLQPMNKQVVENGDVINIDCDTYINGQVVDSIKNLDVMIGTYNFNHNIEDFLIGKTINTNLSFEIDKKTYKIFVNEIKKFVFPEFTEEFLLANFNVKSYADFRQEIETRIYNEKIFSQKTQSQKNIVNQIIEKSIFILKSEDIDTYYQKQLEYYQQIALIYSVTFENYIVQYGRMSIDEFSEKCYNEAVQLLKKDLLVEHIWSKIKAEQREDLLMKNNISKSVDVLTNDDKYLLVYDYLYEISVSD